jgi:hypothetical protein
MIMRHHQFSFLAVLSVFTVLSICCGCEKYSPPPTAKTPPAAVPNEKPALSEPFVMKGFYIGMPRQSAYSVLDKLQISHGDNLDDSGSRTVSTAGLVNHAGGRLFLYYDHNDQLAKLLMEPRAVNSLFNASGMGINDFALAFRQAYNLPEMGQLDSTAGVVGWKCKNEDQGFEVQILFEANDYYSQGGEAIILQRIPLGKQRKFD